MKIGIDGRVLDRQMTGTGRYLLNLLNNLPAIDVENEYYIFLNNTSLVDTKFYKPIPVKESLIPSKLYSVIWLNTVLPKEVEKYGLDLFFTCNIVLPIVGLSSAKKITVVHDVIHKVNKEFYPSSYRAYLNTLLPLTFKTADRIISASHTSKRDMIKYFDVNEDKIEVLYTAAQKTFRERNLTDVEVSKLKARYQLPDSFALNVGVIEKRKNINGIIKIADKLNERGLDLPVVMVGRKGFGFENFDELSRENKNIIYLDYVEDNDLPLLYNLSKVFLFPSFYEGFGIPPLEAMQSGTPVVSSDAGSLQEVLEDGAILLKPDELDKYVIEIEKLISNEDYYLEWKEKGLNRAAMFNMLKSAEKLVQIFNNFKNSK